MKKPIAYIILLGYFSPIKIDRAFIELPFFWKIVVLVFGIIFADIVIDAIKTLTKEKI